ncbi:MAG: antibiotic biosynthesis monooxygenase [Pseudonocardia sp.]|nr:antibiotic biosynthesis monooxygenase [Pseudonocardia sp.]
MISGAADLGTGCITSSAVRVQGPACRPDPGDTVLRWWRSGRHGPVPAPAVGWLELVRSECVAGIRLSRIVVLARGPAEHQDLLIEWWLPQLVAAGEHLSVVDPEDGAVPDGPDDFWLVDGTRVVRLDHNDAGGFAGATIASPAEAIVAQRRLSRLCAVAEPFGSWWARTGGGRHRGLLGPTPVLGRSARADPRYPKTDPSPTRRPTTGVPMTDPTTAVTLINRFTVHGDPVEFERAFAATSAFLTGQPGFVEHTLLRHGRDGVSYVNVARWTSAGALRAATGHPDFTEHAQALRALATTDPQLFNPRLSHAA